MAQIVKRLRTYGILAQRTVNMLLGRSYFHKPQGYGTQFQVGDVAGYYNDLRHKADWKGTTNDAGMPVNVSPSGEKTIVPITVAQKAIAHWDLWLETDSQAHYDAFMRICDWLIANQDERGGWTVPYMTAPQYTSPYTGITQGVAASAFVRAYHRTQAQRYLSAAQRALNLMLMPMSEGGMWRPVADGAIIEEFPADPPNTVLNGWVFSIYGLYDYLLVADDDRFQAALDETLRTLVAHLPRYDMDFWSHYDSDKNPSTPFYHALHIAQLTALADTFPDHAAAINTIRDTFVRYDEARFNRWRALFLKVLQKLKSPPEFVNR